MELFRRKERAGARPAAGTSCWKRQPWLIRFRRKEQLGRRPGSLRGGPPANPDIYRIDGRPRDLRSANGAAGGLSRSCRTLPSEAERGPNFKLRRHSRDMAVGQAPPSAGPAACSLRGSRQSLPGPSSGITLRWRRRRRRPHVDGCSAHSTSAKRVGGRAITR